MTPSWWITAPQTKTAILKAPLKSRQRVSALLQDVEEGREGVEGGAPEVGGDEDLLQIKLKREFTATSWSMFLWLSLSQVRQQVQLRGGDRQLLYRQDDNHLERPTKRLGLENNWMVLPDLKLVAFSDGQRQHHGISRIRYIGGKDDGIDAKSSHKRL